MLLLALDTSTVACSVALLRAEAIVAAEEQPMIRGHAEALLPMVARIMTRAGAPFGAIDRLAVTIGPGHFTGLRAGIAAARGLALALDRPLVGVTTLEAIAAGVPEAERRGRVVIVAIDSKREEAYVQAFDEGLVARASPAALRPADYAAKFAAARPAMPVVLAGDAAEALGRALAALGLEIAHANARGHANAAVVARLAARRPVPEAAPRPLYLHPPETKPAALRPAPLAAS
ncbi:MAG TPA: tRNA (adenosine(37)-N6)-threonylcarbamoyltransferase complex dimerization subunit type 1 TsaB [Alphaproteobacteria bacterium]|nr:tRNA (adenosine(37)-N6)-threonylcarbamoyltransferase complex dimerization subunit type 1 TsaB [Alphaproteobacteria bacterium]